MHALAAAMLLAIAAGSAAAAGRVELDGLQSAAQHDQFIVKYRDGSTPYANAAALQRALDAAARATGQGQGLALRPLRRLAVGADVVRASRKLDRVAAEALMHQLAADPDVVYVEVDRLLQAVLSPNDTRYGEQWQYFDATGGIRADQAWDSATGTGVVVAVIDTGITSHSDLSGNVIAGYDFISDSATARDGNGRDSNPNDEGDWYSAGECGQTSGSNSSWHGTHVAGTVAALTNNAKGVAGTAFNARVSPVRVLGKCGGTISDIADAIIWASGGTVSGVPANANPAEAINLSLGGSGSCSSTMQSAINGAVSRGTTLAVAAGNSNANVSGFTPASCTNVVVVGSTTQSGARSSFSNYGSGVDLAAPGSSILSTLNAGTTTPGAESYAVYSGTSMATPHVAGVIALVQSVATTPKTPAEMETLLKNTARAFPSPPSQPIGAGIVNAKAAVDAANGGGGGGNELTNGVPVTNISGATGSQQFWTLDVPAGAANLQFVTSGGSGDADLYVKFGSAPTTSSYDCRSWNSSNSETCSITTAQAGTYHVLVYGYAAFSGLSLTGSYTTGGGQVYSNTTDYAINDNSTVDSPITVSGRSGNAPSSTPVYVNIVHTYIGDLKVDLVAPDGTLYNIHNRSGGSADNIVKTVNLDLSSEPLNGTWKLRVSDNATQDTGYIDSWSITF